MTISPDANGSVVEAQPSQRKSLFAAAGGAIRSPALWIMTALVLCYAVSQIDRQVQVILITPIKADLGLNDFDVSLLLGPGFAVAYILFGVPLGILADKWSRPKTIFLGLIIWLLATIGCGFANSFAALLMCRALVGSGEAALSPAAHAIITENIPRSRLALAITVFTQGSVLGMSIAMVAGGYLLDLFTRMGPIALPILENMAPWQLVFIMAALPGMVLAPFALTLPEGKRTIGAQAVKPVPKIEFGHYLKTRKGFLICHFADFGFSTLVAHCALAWSGQFLERTYGYSPSQVGLTFGVAVFLCPVVGGLLLSFLVDTLYKRGMKDAHMRGYFWALAAVAPLICYGYFSKNETLSWLGILAALAVMAPIFGVAGAALQTVTPSAYRARMSGALVSFVNITGTIAGMMIIGAMVNFVFKDETKLGPALGIVTAVSVVGALIMLWIGSKFMRQAVDEQMREDAQTA